MIRAARRVALTWSMLSVLAISTPSAPADPWVRIRSANFELFTTAGERSGRDLVRHFEQVRSFFLEVFGVKSGIGKPARIVAFHSEKEYQPFRPNEVATAFYHNGSEYDYIVMSSADSTHYPVATHEFTHLLIGQTGGAVPLWLNEGLAELYSTVEQAGGQILVGKAPPGRGQALLDGRWIGLDVLLAVGHDSPLYNEKSRAGMFYAESWALVHMLNLDKGYKGHLSTLLDLLKTKDGPTAFQDAYGKSLAQVQHDLQGYVGAQYLHAAVFRVPLAPAVESPEIQAHAALKAHIALAELLADYPGKLSQATEAYAALATEFPQHTEVEAALGRFAWRERHNQDAVNHFAKAAELGSTDPRMFLEYARALSGTNHLELAVAAARNATHLDASLQDAHYDLGLLLVRSGAWRDALEELKLARPVKVQQAPRFFYGLAYSEYRLGDMIAARNYVEQGRTYTKIPEEVAALEKLSQTLGPPVVEGMLQNIECQGKVARLHVRAGDSDRIFLIPDMASATDLKCGPQKDIAVRIEYQAMPVGVTGADGIVKMLAFR